MNIIYKIENKKNCNIYIGQTINYEDRKNKHFKLYKKLDQHIYRAMRKYGIENFKMIPVCSVLDVNDLDNVETHFIEEYDSYNNGYNMTKGGKSLRGWKHTEESKRKMSESHKGKISYIWSEKRKKDVSRKYKGKEIFKTNLGKTFSKEHKRKISESNKGINHRLFIGYYHTPFGILESSKDIYKYTRNINPSSIINWCKNSNKLIKKRSKYITNNMIGKTYKELGFWFEEINNADRKSVV